MSRPAADVAGKRFGRLAVLSRAPRLNTADARWHCRCDCGNESVAYAMSLKAGLTRSCGCLKREATRTHGERRSPEYMAWTNMRTRCRNPAATDFKYWGGRGVRVCDRWNRFENFLADMGRRPSPDHSIDRFPNNDGNYEPGNCRWATPTEQANNRRAAA